MEHTFLFQNARWQAQGFYYSKEVGAAAPLTGETVVTRAGDNWTIDRSMDISWETPVHIEDHYDIHTTNNAAQFDWVAQDTKLGTMNGAFIALPSIITSSYTVPDTDISGSEMLMQVSETEYLMEGVINRDGDPESWWKGRLICDAPG